MPGRIESYLVDITKFPAVIPLAENEIEWTIGDIHANPTLLLHALTRRDIIQPSEEQYKRLVTLFNSPFFMFDTTEYEELLAIIKKIIAENKRNKTVLVRLLGDELCDRGPNDGLSYCQIWCTALGSLPVRLFNNPHSVFKFNVVNNKC